MQLSEQLTEQSTAHAETMKGFLLWDGVPSITTISNKGRRAMDQSNLDTQMMEEDEKAGSLRRTRLTPQLAKAMGQRDVPKDYP